MSDLHVEFQDDPYGPVSDLAVYDAVLILLVGDIWSKGRTARWVEEYANVCETPVIWVAGNHEFYGAKIEKSLKEFRATCRNSRQVHFLENDVVEFTVRGQRARVLGCRNQQSAVRRVDGGVRLRTPDWGLAGSSHPPRSYLGDEWRQLSSQSKPKTAELPKKCLTIGAVVDPVGPQGPPTLLRSA